MMSPPSTEDVAQELRLRMLSFDHRVQPPPDLFQRVVAPRRSRQRPPQRFSIGALVTAGVAALVLAVSLGIGWFARQPAARPAAPATTPAMPAPAPVPLPTPDSASAISSAPRKAPAPTKPRTSAPATGVVMAVFNAETACQPLRTLECGLGVYRDPHHPTADQLVARVWHGDKVTASCVVPDGMFVRDEAGVTSTRWYRVTTATGATGYLPGVRTRNATEVAICH
jgi:hypothetical protein